MKTHSASADYNYILRLIKVTIFAFCTTFQAYSYANLQCIKKSFTTYQVTDPSNGRVFDLSPLTPAQAHKLFTGLLRQSAPGYFRYNLESGCVERAENVSSWLLDKGLASVHVNLQTENGGLIGATGASYLDGGADDGNTFLFESLYENKLYSWGHHAATAICLVKSKGDSKGVLHILDPSTLLGVSTLKSWRDQLVHTLPKPYDTSSWSLNLY